MYTSIYLSNKLKCEYERLHNFKYDCVIRCRFDVLVHDRIDVLSYNLNNMNVKYFPKDKWEHTNDWIAFGTSSVMDVHADTVNNMDNINAYFDEQKRNSGYFQGRYPECMLHTHLMLNNTMIDYHGFNLGIHDKCGTSRDGHEGGSPG